MRRDTFWRGTHPKTQKLAGSWPREYSMLKLRQTRLEFWFTGWLALPLADKKSGAESA